MNWDAIGAIGEIVGALAVVASLIYLSIQIKRSDESARAQSLQSVLDGHRDRTLFPIYTNPTFSELIARGSSDLESLTKEEKPQYQAWLAEIVLQMQQANQLHERGLLPDVDFDAWLYYTVSVLKTPGGTACWPTIEVTLTPTIRDIINGFIKANPDMPSYIEMNPLVNRGRANDT